jgi:hypothetical protein
LALLTPLLPTLMAIGSIAGAVGGLGLAGGGEGEGAPAATGESGPGNGEIIAKLDQLIAVIQQPGVINMDGKQVGEVLHMAKGLTRT